MPVQKKLSDRDFLTLLDHCAVQNDIENELQIVFKRKIIDNVGYIFHCKLSHVFILMAKVVSVHDLEEFIKVLHNLVVIGLHKYWKGIE